MRERGLAIQQRIKEDGNKQGIFQHSCSILECDRGVADSLGCSNSGT